MARKISRNAQAKRDNIREIFPDEKPVTETIKAHMRGIYVNGPELIEETPEQREANKKLALLIQAMGTVKVKTVRRKRKA